MGRNVLMPAESGKFIAEHSSHVKIHENGLEKLCDHMLKSISDKLEIPDTQTRINRPAPSDPRAVDWVFVCDALNFCFWTKSDEPKYVVNGETGYYALEAALSKAISEGYDILNPEYYSKITKEELSHIFRGDTEVQIPLLDNRLAILHEVGKILMEKYSGTFKTCVESANKSAEKLLEVIVEEFPSFRDEVHYKGKRVALYKRAQILVADLWSFFGGEKWGEFYDIDKITMFADYRVPQVLVYFGVLSYSDELMKKLENDELLPSGSEEEVEIRGCSIHAIELLKEKLAKKISERNINAQVPNSSLIDYYLWCYRRAYAAEMERIPFHKTLGIFY